MKRSKLTVTIAVIGYNEEKSILRILQSICSQQQPGFVVNRIVVLSDGSTDATVLHARKCLDNRVIVLDEPVQKGKARRINQLFASEQADILVILDADVVLEHTSTIAILLKPLIRNSDVGFASGKIQPIPPKTLMQQVIYTGFLLMNQAKTLVANSDVYNCTGAIRAFRRSFYKKIQFPYIAAEDIYPYFFAKRNKYTYKIVPKALVFYGLPDSFVDYQKQMNRYLNAVTEYEMLFGKQAVCEAFSITFTVKLLATGKMLLSRPVWTIAYLFLLLFPKLQAFFRINMPKGIWESVKTSKI